MMIAYSLIANSQDNLRSALLSMNKNAGVLDKLISQVENDLKKDKHRDMGKLATGLKNELVSINRTLNTMAEPERGAIASVISTYINDVDNFGNLTNKGRVFDNDKQMGAAFNSMKAAHMQFRELLKTIYSKSLQSEEQKAPAKQSAPVQESVAKEPINPSAPYTEVNVLIAESKKKISLYIDSIHIAMKKNDFARVGKLSSYISNNCLQIEDLSLLLKTDQKGNIKVLSRELRTYGDELQQLAKKGAIAHHAIHEVLEKSEIKFKSLSVALNFEQ